MKLSRAQIVLIAILVLGFGALAIDRLLVGYGATEPQTTQAATLMPQLGVIEKMSAVIPIMNSQPQPRQADSLTESSALVRQLKKLADEHQLETTEVINAFDATSLMPTPEERAQAKQAEDAKAETTEAKPAVAPFEQRHRLEATMVADNRSWALVDGKMIRLGQQVKDGEAIYQLFEVREHEAVFLCEEKQVVLRISISAER